jgi:aspartate/methionine/tyrosine aminotransferase
LDALGNTLARSASEKIFLLLNFPNNPTGYTPSLAEMEELKDLLVELARSGKRLVVVVDDAYFGLFHDEHACRSSLFSLLWNAHENLLAVKCDAATKESLVWGFRIGFITFGACGLTDTHYHAMVQKTMGTIRSSVSSCSRVGQSLLLAAMRHEDYGVETKRVADEMARRCAAVRESILTWRGSVALQPLPFNSGYFCTFACAGDAESLRRYLLENHGIGTVSIGKDLLRIAYSGVDAKLLPQMIDTVYRSAETIWK